MLAVFAAPYRRLKRACGADCARSAGARAFRRQHPIGPYALDFYCANARLAVEIDGMSHELCDRPKRDTRRDALAQGAGRDGDADRRRRSDGSMKPLTGSFAWRRR